MADDGKFPHGRDVRAKQVVDYLLPGLWSLGRDDIDMIIDFDDQSIDLLAKGHPRRKLFHRAELEEGSYAGKFVARLNELIGESHGR
jgi:hypothetical protein